LTSYFKQKSKSLQFSQLVTLRSQRRIQGGKTLSAAFGSPKVGCSKKTGEPFFAPGKLIFRLTRMGFGVSLAAPPAEEFVA
jgi:hypothetical protein